MASKSYPTLSSDEARDIFDLLSRLSVPKNAAESVALAKFVRSKIDVEDYWVAAQIAWWAIGVALDAEEVDAPRPLLAARHLLGIFQYPEDRNEVFGPGEKSLKGYFTNLGSPRALPILKIGQRQAIAAREGGYGGRTQLSGKDKRLPDVTEAVWTALRVFFAKADSSVIDAKVRDIEAGGPPDWFIDRGAPRDWGSASDSEPVSVELIGSSSTERGSSDRSQVFADGEIGSSVRGPGSSLEVSLLQFADASKYSDGDLKGRKFGATNRSEQDSALISDEPPSDGVDFEPSSASQQPLEPWAQNPRLNEEPVIRLQEEEFTTLLSGVSRSSLNSARVKPKKGYRRRESIRIWRLRMPSTVFGYACGGILVVLIAAAVFAVIAPYAVRVDTSPVSETKVLTYTPTYQEIANTTGNSNELVNATCAPSFSSLRRDALSCALDMNVRRFLDPCFLVSTDRISCPNAMDMLMGTGVVGNQAKVTDHVNATWSSPDGRVGINGAEDSPGPWLFLLDKTSQDGVPLTCRAALVATIDFDGPTYNCATGNEFPDILAAPDNKIFNSGSQVQFAYLNQILAGDLDRNTEPWTVEVVDPANNTTERVAVSKAWF